MINNNFIIVDRESHEMRDSGGRVSPSQGGVVEAGQEGEGDQAAQQGEAAQRQVLSTQSRLKQTIIYLDGFISQAEWNG